ncbi:MAG: anti-sigma factor domain-containing protein [Desulfosporosinus sp.]|nr:anti-sigma factor domain-containing protein [Desulfosporosinus sp.]
MSKMKAVVLEKSGSRYTVLGENGSFRQVHRRLKAEVGEEIEIRTGLMDFSGLRVWAGVAALFLLVLTSLLGWNLYQAPTAVALLSVDINPSLQFTIDAQGRLVKFQTQNEDAKRMLNQIDLTGKPIAEVLEQIVTQAYNQKFLNSEQHWVVVGYSPLTDKSSDQMPKELNENQIITWVTGPVEKEGFTPQVAVFPLTSQESELAQKGDLTIGEYALWQTAQQAGVVTQPETLKDTSERVRLLENPLIQAQIQSKKRGIESGWSRTPGTATQDLGSIDKSKKGGTGRPMPEGLPSSPVQVPKSPALETGEGQNKDKGSGKNSGKDNGKDIGKINGKVNGKVNGEDHGQTDTKDPDKAKNNAYNETDLSKERDNFNIPVLPPIPTPENSKHDLLRSYKIPERFDVERKNNKSEGRQR